MTSTKIILFWFTSLLLLLPLDPVNLIDRRDKIYTSVFKLNIDEQLWVENTLSRMSLKEKCAQMVFPYAASKDTATDSEDYQRLVKLVTENKVGGIIFFQGEILKQAVITNKLQALSETPLLICSDYERGLGMRLSDAVEFPYNMAVAAANDPRLTYLMGKYIAEEARALGVHVNFAPLLDVNRDYRNPIINIRSYSEDAQIISLHGSALINGMHSGKMITTAKHFPGHGATDLDSHNELSLIELTRRELSEVDLVPFKHAIKAGVKGVMIGHLEVPAYESKRGIPATFSKSVVTGLLKDYMNFEGLVITDAMNMHTIAKNYSHEDAAKLAVKAGNDIVLFPVDEEAAINGIYEAVINNEISEERINHSVRKILAAKKWVGADINNQVNLDELKNSINTCSHKRAASEIARKSITLLKDNTGIIPINPDDYYRTAVITITQSDSRRIEATLFEELLQDELGYVKNYRLNRRSRKSNYQKALNIARKSSLIILSTYLRVRAFSGSVQLDSDHVNFINDLIALNKPLVVANFGNPYLLSEFPGVGTYLCSYGDVDVSQLAMADALLGKSDIGGRLPITIPNTNFTLGGGIRKSYSTLRFPNSQTPINYNFTRVDSLMKSAIEDEVFPGGVLLVGHKKKVVFHKAFGHHTYQKNSPKVTTNSIFDLASLTKVIATTSAAMILYDHGELKLDEPVVKYLPQFAANEKEKVTVGNLLLHNSGLPAFVPFYKNSSSAVEVIDHIMNIELEYSPGSKYVYSDLGMITLQKIIESIAGKRIDKFLDEKLFIPLEMNRTMFNPPPEFWFHCAPTERDNYWRMTTLKGKVHDETACLLNGVAGHAGLFSTAHDLAIFAQTILNEGEYAGRRYFNSKTINMWTKKQTSQSSRAMGWDTKSAKGYSSAGKNFSNNSFGHTGFTGTSIWIDKDRELFVILLTNRIHPSRKNRKIINFRPVIHDAVVDAISYD